jgi:hypothetical protein
MTDESSMVPSDPSPFDDATVDFEGCTDARHCHGKRSVRQPDAYTPEGKRRVCHKPKGWGTIHPGTGTCKHHGGSAPSSIKAAQAEVARQAIQTLGVPVDVGPADALLQEVQRTAGHVAWLAHVIAGLERDELVWGLAEEVIEPDITSKDGDTIIAQVTGKMKADFSVWYKMYAQERRHLANVCKLALDAGVNERIVSMYEQVGDTFVTMIENVLNAIGLTDEQRRAVPAAVVTELTRLTGDVG